MNPNQRPEDLDQLPEAVVEPESKGFPVVWLLPLVALLVGGWLLYKTVSEKGPEIVITFKTAEGIEEGKTKIKFRDVTIGQVDTVRFAKDLSHVEVTAGLVPGMERHLNDNTRFWVVRPRVGAGEVSGLGTLISGAYIGMDPGEDGKSTRKFAGLEKPPIVSSEERGTTYHLHSAKLGSLSVGSPVYFRQIVVGEVTGYALAEDHRNVDVNIFIRAPHDRFVHAGTRFWNVGGVDLAVDASGVRLEMESLVALITGGIAFETPRSLTADAQAPEGTVFELYENHARSIEQPITRGYPFVLKFNDTVRGLHVGAPVELRGIRIGTVTDIEARLAAGTEQLLIPVLVEIEPERVFGAAAFANLSGEEHRRHVIERAADLVERGMRARLQTGNLLTGQLFVELDFVPNAEPATLDTGGQYPEIPTVPRPLSGMTASVSRILERLEKTPLEQTVTDLDKLIVSTRQLIDALNRETPMLAAELRGTSADTRAMLEDASTTLESLRGMTSKDGELGNELYRALEELRAAARSIRVMSEYLERHPEALLKGKGQ